MSTPTPIALVLEDEREIRQFVRTSLEAEGWQVFEAGTVKQGLVEAGTRRPDLVIADLGLPDGDGVDFIRELRTWSGVPIIVLSARTHESDKVAALDAGADDFITKPFGVAELLARTRANLRRVRAGRAAPDSIFRFGDVEVDLAARVVKKRGAEVHLTPIEYRLLGVLIANAGRVLTHPSPAARGVGADALARARTTCASTWATCGRSSKTTRRSPSTSSPRPASAIGC